MPSAFITRNITNQSPFYQLLTNQGFEVSGQSFIAFEAILFYDLSEADWLFFYSKNAIRFFFENCKKYNILTDNYRIATIGKASAEFLKEYQKTINFIGTGEPKTTANQFAEIAKGTKVIFPRAVNSRKSVQQLLKNQIDVIDLIVYKNQPITSVPKRVEDFLVFTSPMNATAYLKHHTLNQNQQIVAIGQTTGNAIRQLGFQKILIAEKPSEKGLAQCITAL